MIDRVTDTLKYNLIANGMFANARESAVLTEQMGTQKKVNRPSDNPMGTTDILSYRSVSSSLKNYQDNIGDASVWLTMSSTNLQGIVTIVDQIRGIADSESGYMATYQTRSASASMMGSNLGDVLSLMNSQSGDNYLFSGSATDVKPFADTYKDSSVSMVSGEQNSYSGVVTVTGDYMPTENENYAVRIVEAGTELTAKYKVSTDGGKTWGAVATLNGAIDDVGGVDVDLAFAAGTFAVNDTFTVNLKAAGYYHGNDDSLSTLIGKNNNIDFNITGAKAFTGQFASADFTGNVVLKGGKNTTNGTNAITADTTWSHIHNANVQNGTKIEISGFDHDGKAVPGLDESFSFVIENAATGTVQNLLDQIELQFGPQTTASVDANGRITLTDYAVGASRMELTLNVTNQGDGKLDLGTVSSTLYEPIVLKRGATAADWTIASVNTMSSVTIFGTPTAESLTLRIDNGATTSLIEVKLTGDWSKGNEINLAMAAGVTKIISNFTGSGTVDLLSIMKTMGTALNLPEADQKTAVKMLASQKRNLELARIQIYRYQAMADAKNNSVKLAESNNNALNLQITNKKTEIENADLTELIMEFQMKQTALQASYNIAAKIGQLTILDYL